MSKRLDVKLGFNCNNHCTFCVQGNKRELYSPRKQEEIYRILEEGREKGAEDIVFTGGEPTVHKTLLESIRRAKALGYGRIQIQSNGRAFSLRNFTESLIEAGANEFSPSIHGARQKPMMSSYK
jgi:MoaA/NifB/PqqE/SkfB family radical SAM enzyme